MGFLKGTATFTRYLIPGDLPPDFSSFFDRQIKAHAFRGIPAGPEEKSVGWTTIDNIIDSDFEYAGYLYGDYRLFSLRIDRKTVPPALLRVRIMEAEQRILSEKGLKRLYREQRVELKEAVRGDLLKTAVPVPSFHEVCWSLAEGWLLFGSLSDKATEEFEAIFKRTFSVTPVPFVPWDPVFLDDRTRSALAELKGARTRAHGAP